MHDGKAKSDKIDAHKIAVLLRGGMFPLAYVYPPEMRATRDLLRRRNLFVRKRAELMAHIQNTVIHDLYREVSAQIDCTQCANCCKAIQSILTAADIKRLARHVGLTTKEFRSRFLRENDEGEGFVFNAQPCPFLKDNRCAVYENRPRDCRSYPHLHKREFAARVSQAFSNCPVFPIVFNVYERLKHALRPTLYQPSSLPRYSRRSSVDK